MSEDPRREIRPVDTDGVAVITAGTVVWGVLLVVSLALQDRLRDDGHLWWIAVAAVGFGLGLLGIWRCVRLRERRRRSALEVVLQRDSG